MWWDRDLVPDLDAVRNWGAAAVVTLIEYREMKSLGVQRLGEEVKARNMAWFHLPIVDASIPDEEFEEEWKTAGNELRRLLREGRDVVVHCCGGKGRAGTIAARLLIEFGVKPETAITQVRAVRNGAIETAEQEEYVRRQVTPPRRSCSNDWFESLIGFAETGYEETRAKIKIEGGRLHSLANGKSYGIGQLELVSLQTLRDRVKSAGGLPGRLKVDLVSGDVRNMHRFPENAGALFQVASQFNLLEMTGPDVTPEQGVTRYQSDNTQGPACAVAAGAATIYRNYFAPVNGIPGQTAHRQLNGLADLGAALSAALNKPVLALWDMRNGYAQCKRPGLEAITKYLWTSTPEQIEMLRGKLRIGIHRDVEVTDDNITTPPVVSQAFCSALPVGYSSVPRSYWKEFASLVLEAAYEATMLAAVLNAQRGTSNVVLLTRLGGGAFGNDASWIDHAMFRALKIASGFALEVRLVAHGVASPAMVTIAQHFRASDVIATQ